MCKIRVEKLTKEGLAEIPFYEIKKAIVSHKNLMVEYQGLTMEIGWESLVGKFGQYPKSPKGIENWHFRFVPNYHLMEEEK